MSTLLLDTCAVLALGAGSPMRPQVLAAIRAAEADRGLLVPSIAAMEIAQKHAAGRLILQGGLGPRAWLAELMQHGGLRSLDITAEMALGAYELPPPFHKDLADRLIVAAARLLEVPVVTIDRNILAYAAAGHVEALAYQ